MNPLQHNLDELRRLRHSIETDEPIDWKKEVVLADFDEAIAQAHYTQQAIDRVNQADEALKEFLHVE